ncbi:tRNA guanosine(34) transglycosylase Tgt [Caldisericum exile]|uniref:Queuine tRNA-ribosyltransferase n=1 Tax=Caldisericum exile (strain DSM 21853 / NBRC 104410 / AZM16c01) TaxID=511051 RepID=A0A7U6GEE5_CALEA|nr:tRNA guanosine(34) transglycosylase Tgt [Caldisericum exile]BAL80863.1 queuine tRNA-ribosyltransferase [Caldisericum exile AZM16c01]
MFDIKFKVLAEDSWSRARITQFETPHGTIETPVFMPVGTQATVKTLTSDEIREIGFKIILSNTYHLYLQPGASIIEKAGGIHKFMDWDGAVLTDSGGFQVLSLKDLRKINSDGVEFKSFIDGSKHFFTPELVIETQEKIGSDIAIPLDICGTYPSPHSETKRELDITVEWAKRSLKAHKREDQILFGVIQGGFYKDLRKEAVERILELDFPGVTLGGLSIGEEKELTAEMVDYTVSLLPKYKPRYFMGVGDPISILEYVRLGVDMFDCVLPTRIARNRTLFTKTGTIKITKAIYKEDFTPIENDCGCYTCKHYTKAYLNHLFKAKEHLAGRLATIHNLYFMNWLIQEIRKSIKEGYFKDFYQEFKSKYKEGNNSE